MDFAETRAYQPGDEPRHINWRAMARTGTPMVSIFHDDLTPVACFVVDHRSSMRFGTHVRLKVTQAARLAIFIATWEARRGTELCALTLDDQLYWQPPVSGQSGLQNITRRITTPCPPIEQAYEPGLEKTLRVLSEQLPPGSHIYLLSDFHDLTSALRPQLYRIAQTHHVIALGITDIAEHVLPAAGRLNLVWSHAQHVKPFNSDSRILREHCRTYFSQYHQRIKRLCEETGVHFIPVKAGENNLSAALSGEKA
jgi:uncharacterized protein (DUF58 family)